MVYKRKPGGDNYSPEGSQGEIIGVRTTQYCGNIQSKCKDKEEKKGLSTSASDSFLILKKEGHYNFNSKFNQHIHLNLSL